MQLGEDTTTMSMTLNPVNEAAFQKAVQSLETLNRAAVFHPTGTGKSCIAWKVVEAHPQTTFFWLVAGAQRLALRQAELTRYNGGTLPGNVRFCDCEKLAAATPEQWVRLGEQKPGCIVLDCYHELSAVCWAQSVQKLLRMCPQAKVLGLGVPNGAPVCAAAQELFADCIVSHMTVAEAMAAGTMPVPSAYAALLWPQEEELATLRARIKNLCMPKGDTSLRVQYEELSWSLRQVENLTVLLPRLLSDTSGHYLVLFESAAYQEKLGAELEQLLRTVDPAVRFYAADHACFADSAAVETFLSDTAPGPKVLLCVNAPGVQQPLEGLAGVILVRQSSQMSTFKLMLCRALVAAGRRRCRRQRGHLGAAPELYHPRRCARGQVARAPAAGTGRAAPGPPDSGTGRQTGKTGHPLEPPAGSCLGKRLCLRAEIPHRAWRSAGAGALPR